MGPLLAAAFIAPSVISMVSMNGGVENTVKSFLGQETEQQKQARETSERTIDALTESITMKYSNEPEEGQALAS
ncbi:hypothetical protein [Aestuariispira insulae]|uniref:Uncharacterized protein n=1 Tax=Aestuariispira insulae TaxID=1461337 RepID=A0A3D9H3E3_9PROT|nr:hypothetical protein [Aestuariispira insulae]RED43721.1 hypothetical protein DFP90_1205 [Aestuariispira insulae]